MPSRSLPSGQHSTTDLTPHTDNIFSAIYPLVLITVVASLATSAVNVALPQISTQFDVAMSVVQWNTIAFLIMNTLFIVPMGTWGDRFGKERVLFIGIALFAVASVAGIFATHIELIILARAIQGIGAAAMTALSVALIRQVVAPASVGRAMGWIGSSMATGMALGPALGGLLLGWEHGWRLIFVLLAALSATAGILAKVKLVVAPRGTGAARFNLASIRHLGIATDILLAFLANVVMMTFSVIPPFFLTQGLGYTNSAMGAIMVIGPLAAAFSGVPAGRLVGRLGTFKVTILGFILMAVATIVLASLAPAIGIIGFIIGALLLTPGNQLFMASNNTRVMTRADKASQGTISGLLNLSRGLGGITATVLMSQLYEATASATPGAQGALNAMQVAFFSAAFFALVALLLSLVKKRRAARTA